MELDHVSGNCQLSLNGDIFGEGLTRRYFLSDRRRHLRYLKRPRVFLDKPPIRTLKLHILQFRGISGKDITLIAEILQGKPLCGVCVSTRISCVVWLLYILPRILEKLAIFLAANSRIGEENRIRHPESSGNDVTRDGARPEEINSF